MANPYERLAVVSIQDLLDHNEATGGEPMIVLGERVRIGSLRMQTFREKGHVCAACGLKATHYAVERHKRRGSNGDGYHMNLWGIGEQGNEVLFTHDHILARCLGGKDHISNTTTMCSPCNGKKGVQEKLMKDAQDNGVSVKEWMLKRKQLQNLPSQKESKAAKREAILEKLRTDPEYRQTVYYHQKRLGKNQYPEIFGKLS